MKTFLKTIKTTALLAALCCAFIACGDSDDDGTGGGNGNGNTPTPPGPEPEVSSITPIEKLNQGPQTINSHADVTSRSSLKMNFRTYAEPGESEIGVSKPHYARIKKMANGNYIMFYHNNEIGASCSYSTSSDLKNWTFRGKIFNNYKITDSKEKENERRYANCDGVVLSNGDILAAVSYRANSGYRDLPKDAGVEIKRSTDNGATWSNPIEIYQGVNWEPYLLELPSGEIHCYFTDSSRTGIKSTDTGTVMVVSKDGGKTWTPSFGSLPYYVIRMKWDENGNTYFNHQMPSVIKLNGGNKLAAAMETNYLGTYYISFAFTGDDGAWTHLNPDQEGPVDSKNLQFKGSAPYLVQFPSGETVVSYNEASVYKMKIGDAQAQNFGPVYTPFSGKGFWGTLNMTDSHRVIGAMPNTSAGKVMLAQFVLNHRISAIQRSVTVDGENLEWANTDDALFVGEKSQAQATLRCSFDKDNVYFLVEVLDKSVSKDDFATIYLSPVTNDDKLASGAYRIKVSSEGLKSTEAYNTAWTNNTDLGAKASAKVFDASNTDNSNSYGYITEISVPRSKLNIQSGQILVNFSITDSQSSEDAISNPASTSTASWIPVSGL